MSPSSEPSAIRVRPPIRKRLSPASALLAVYLLIPAALHGFESGFTLQLRSQFAGGLTNPEISDESLKYLNNRATEMTGNMSNLLMGGNVEVGYIFRSDDYFGLKETAAFSGAGVFLYLGFSQGNTSQVITAEESGEEFDIFVSVDYLPVVDFGVTGKGYFLDNKLAVGLSLGGRMIADMTPEYLCYSTEPSIIDTEVGTVIVSEELRDKANPFMFCTRLDFEYNIFVLPTTELVLGAFAQYSFFKPKFLTIPPSLLDMALADNPSFDPNREYPDYRLDSLEFGVTLGLAFKL